MAVLTPTAVEAPADAPGPIRTFFAGMRGSTTGFIGMVVFTVICVGAVLGPLFVSATRTPDPTAAYQWPSGAHWLGTDDQGSDVLRQILSGGRDVIVVGLVSASVSTLIAVLLGALAAYRGGWFDSMMVQAADFFLTVPQFAVLVVLSAYLRLGDAVMLALLIGLLGWPSLLRAVRAQVMSLKEREYVEAARLLDLGTVRIVCRDILPNMASYLMVNFIMALTSAVYSLVGLYLLGLAPMSGTNWGIMINLAWTKGALFYSGSLFYLLSPLIAVALLQLSAIWLVRSLEEILNPRLRGQG